MMDGPDIHCPKCKTPMIAWNWDDQILYTCSGCDVLGFNIERSGIDFNGHDVIEVVDGAKCKGCSEILERREAKDVDLYTCTDCNVGLFANVKELQGIKVDLNDPGSCANHKEMRQIIGNAYDKIIASLKG
jgi:ssDNA-binding Zn-finger/Zn-ribbon topoisomerase 1